MSEEMLIRAAMFEPSSYDAERGTVEAVISSGADVARLGYVERLRMDPAAWSKASDVIPVLKDHRREVDSLVGAAEDVRIENGRAVATIRLSEGEPVIRQKVADGTLRSVSIGYTVPKWREYSENGNRIREAERIVLHEISLTPVGADREARLRSEVNMTEELQTRIRNIAEAVGVAASVAEGLIQRNATLEEARSEIIRTAAAGIPAIENRAPATITRDAGDGLVERLADGLYSRINPAHKPEAGREFAYHRIADVARECLRLRGLNTLGSQADILTRALHSTSDFPNVLAEVFNKTLLELRTSPSPITQIFRRATVADFRARHVMEISDGPALQKVGEGGEVTFGSISDKELASYKIDSYARAFGISFQALANDDTQALADIAAKMTRGARAWFDGFLVDTIIANPTLADGVAVFHSNHGNLAASGAAPSETTIAAGKAAIRKQTDLGGNPLNIAPRYIVAPVALENAIDQLLAQLYPQQPSEAVVAARTLTPVIDARFDLKNQAAAWYLFCDPASAPVFEYAELSGFEGPLVESRQGFTTLGTEVRVVWHLGAGAIDSRGGWKNPGA